MIRVNIPSHLDSYTGGERDLGAEGKTLAEILSHLDERFPGIRFRIIDEQDQLRAHIKLFINQDMATTLEDVVGEEDVVTVTAALSGG